MFRPNLDVEELHTRIGYELLRLRAASGQPDFGSKEIDPAFVSGAYE
jgi:hypothetical protein